jgi:hypothetical protein
MPVALCVGINYGQGPLFLAPLPLRSVTGMLPFAKLAIPKATGIPLVPFHLVAANFFPWITLDEWSLTVTNALKEHLLLETCGFADPVKHISSLVALLQPEWLIFHGVGCCVPSLGMKVRNALYRETIFCDNLSGPPTSNAIVY